MKKLFVFLSVLPGLFAADAARPARAQSVFAPDLLRDRLWDDGKAEYNVYRAQEMREGITRPTEVVHILVKEPFNPKLRVKADRPTGTEVLKLNQVINVPTGSYAYHQMHSSFWNRASGALIKFSMSSNDSCGNTFKLGWLENGFLRLAYDTYWDGEGDGRLDLRLPSGAVFYDELPFKLRCLPRAAPAEYRVTLFPTVIGSRLGRNEPGPATIHVTQSETFRDVEVRSAAGTDRFRLESAFPYTLRRWMRADGSSLELAKAQRLDYWNHGHPGDESFLR